MAVQQSDTDKADLGPLNTSTSDSQHHQSPLSVEDSRRRPRGLGPRCGVLSLRQRSVNPELKTPLSGVGHASASSSARQLCKSPPSFQLHWRKQYGHCLGTDHPAGGLHYTPSSGCCCSVRPSALIQVELTADMCTCQIWATAGLCAFGFLCGWALQNVWHSPKLLQVYLNLCFLFLSRSCSHPPLTWQ